MSNENTPALRELGQKIQKENRVYVSRETRDKNRFFMNMEGMLTGLMSYSLNKNNPKDYREKATKIFQQLFQFHEFLTFTENLDNASTKQPELFGSNDQQGS